ncbi:MAG: bifunctional tetrahydrofolate synthase/dihydrofolate synthase [Burkholderiales bacterium]|nr:bifunctional tetrahydrofolate synthase/dihydrofolate synthase [Burkholderiales bacterium]MDE2158613.1 bifunctional tetrahydrofolate synthase/dihydrofolate synthase [Burkholderiales bacterium]MDE2502772.1 bifunctional tetrahydrofolate synthase/dihydrofolate synthase [Burkholderiales bacterium]
MNEPTTLADWLAHCARLHPATMDLSLERTVEVARRLGLHFEVPVITVAGTNGKGSTCAMIESIARHAGYRVGLYQKPELVHFEERCRVGGAAVAAHELVPHFAAVEAARREITLTQFEFSTLAIARLLSMAALDLVILEVGLGGRYDSVNAFDTDCAVITGIALDHMEYLGPDREAIAAEKAQIMRPGKPAIVGDPQPPRSLLAHAEAIGADLWLIGRDFNYQGDRQQWGWSGRGRRYHGMSYPALRGANQLFNASAAIAALIALRERLPINAQAVRTGLALVDLPGRFQVVPGQPVLVLDVAHNAQAVAALAANLDAQGYFPRTHAVFGVMADKDIPALLERIAPLVDAWYCCDLPTPRAARAADLAPRLRAAAGTRAVTVEAYPDPASALQAAQGRAEAADRIVAFGSFYTVGGVLKSGRLHGPKPAG